MPLRDFFQEQQARLIEFLGGAGTSLCALEHAPDIRQLLLKLLVAVDGDDRHPHILLVVDAPFERPEQFLAAALDQLVEHNESHRAELAKLDRTLPPPPRDPVPSERQVAVFLTYVSGVAAALPNPTGAYGIIFSLPEIANRQELRRLLLQLASGVHSPRVKFLVFDDLHEPLFQDLPERSRVVRQRFHLSPNEIEKRVQLELASGKLPPQDQLRYTAMAGAFAAAHRRHGEAEELQKRVLQLAQESGSPSDQASAYYNLGNTYLNREQWDEAEAAYSRAAEICLGNEIHTMLALVLCNLGVVLQRQNRMKESLESFEIAGRTFRALDNPPGEAYAWDCKASVLGLAGRRDEATEAWQRALACYDSITNPAMSDVREHGRRDILDKLDRYRAAAIRSKPERATRRESGP